MSQEKAQLIAPLGNMTVPGVTATGVITATSFEGNIAGSASSIKQGSSVSAGVVTASSFAGNLTGNIQRLADSAPNISVGVVTATSFSGNLTGSVTDLTSQPAISVGVVTATSFSGPVTGDIRGNITGNVSGVATGSVTGDVSGLAQAGLGINYNGGWTGAGTSQITAGVVTATSFYGDGSNLDGVSSGPVSQQSINIDGTSATTVIDLSAGNLIYITQSANTIVSFANSENGNVYIVRTKDDTSTARTITWPTGIGWSGGSAPTLINNPRAADAQVFLLVTRNMGETWYAKEVMRSDPQTFGIWSWGTNNQGQLGQNQPTSSDLSSPTQVGSASGWDRVHSARRQTVAIKDNGTMWTVGYNISGSMGLNQPSTTKISSPTQLGTETTWSEIQSTTSVTLATKTDGTLWTWGTNYHGELGQNDGSYPGGDRSSPVQIPGTTWSDNLGRGKWASFAIKTDGTLWGWGRNYYGTLGQNSVHQPGNVGLSSPTQIPGTTWEVISGGDENVLAKKTDGTLWAWGQNENGTLGLNNNDVSRSSPTQLGTETTWNSICAGLTNLATKTDGTLWVWGANEYGQLGINAGGAPNYVGYSSPTQIGTGTTWSGLVAIKEDMFATKTDGTLWSWGNNGDGELGLNDVTSRSSPTQIPGTDWNTIHGEQTGDPTRGDNISWLRAF